MGRKKQYGNNVHYQIMTCEFWVSLMFLRHYLWSIMICRGGGGFSIQVSMQKTCTVREMFLELPCPLQMQAEDQCAVCVSCLPWW